VTAAEARLLVAALVAAFPHPRVPAATIALYREQLAKLGDIEAARGTVELLIQNEDRFPPVAAIRREYQPLARRNADERARTHGLPEPPADPRNVERARALLKRLEVARAERLADARRGRRR
jgi:hypothetical protein